MLTCLGALTLPIKGTSQTVSEYDVKAVFIYNFTQFIQWPEASFDPSQEAFVIGVLGDNVFGKALEEAVAGEKYQSRPIVVKYFTAAKDIENCQVLYVGNSVNAAKQFSDRAVLTVGERPDFMQHKGLLRFYQEGNKLRIEINQAAASAAGLSISSKLLRLATIYDDK